MADDQITMLTGSLTVQKSMEEELRRIQASLLARRDSLTRLIAACEVAIASLPKNDPPGVEALAMIDEAAQVLERGQETDRGIYAAKVKVAKRVGRPAVSLDSTKRVILEALRSHGSPQTLTTLQAIIDPVPKNRFIRAINELQNADQVVMGGKTSRRFVTTKSVRGLVFNAVLDHAGAATTALILERFATLDQAPIRRALVSLQTSEHIAYTPAGRWIPGPKAREGRPT